MLVPETSAAGLNACKLHQIHRYDTDERIIQTFLQSSQAHALLRQLPETDQAQQACQQAAECLSAASKAPVTCGTYSKYFVKLSQCRLDTRSMQQHKAPNHSSFGYQDLPSNNLSWLLEMLTSLLYAAPSPVRPKHAVMSCTDVHRPHLAP